VSKQIKPGDNILIYRSDDISGFTALGVVEDTLRSSDPEEIARYVGTRTVYSYEEIRKFCEKETLAIRFRYAKGLEPAIRLKEIKKAQLIHGAPQSISKLKEKTVKWIQQKIKM
jgi:hypothetical protein